MTFCQNFCFWFDNTRNLFTIADLSNVWVVCDVYTAVRLNAFPDSVFKGSVSDVRRRARGFGWCGDAAMPYPSGAQHCS